MMRIVPGLILILICFVSKSTGQSFEWVDRQENIQAGLGQSIKVPIRIKNTSDKAQFFIIKRTHSDLGINQKGYFCLGDECSDPSVDQYTKRLEPGETLSNLNFVVETGLISTNNSLRFEVFPKGNLALSVDHAFTLSVDEKPGKSLVFQSREITIHDVYPNPVVDQAYIDYRVAANENLKAKVVIHNILGSPVGNYDLPGNETRIKIQADELASGVYFYTVYLNNVGVLTRKLVVRK
ncbi:MAG TPA: T9SS type A sorting domain-containing protein [Cyclobacteriaceae bacterium]|nr:T9SS type A sorting domain-containing protein [Cyclobacteriaceae bacterium]